MKTTLHWINLSVCIGVICLCLTLVVVFVFVSKGVLNTVSDNQAAMACVHLIREYIEETKTGPSSWDDLAFATSEDLAHYGFSSIEELEEIIEIDFSAIRTDLIGGSKQAYSYLKTQRKDAIVQSSLSQANGWMRRVLDERQGM